MTTDHRKILLETIHEHREEVKTELLLAHRAYLNPIPGSPRHQDLQWIHGKEEAHHKHFEDLSDSAFDEVLGKFAAIDEYIDAIALLIEADKLLPIPTLALLRSVQEALLEVYWCVAEGKSTEDRMSRFAALILGNLRDSIPALKLVPNSNRELDIANKEYACGQDYFEEIGFALHWDRNNNKILSVEFEGKRTNLKINTTDSAKQMDPFEEYTWMLGSGAAHSRSWFIKRMHGSSADVSTMYLSVIFTSLRSVSSIGKYVGISNEKFEACVTGRLGQALEGLRPI